MPQSKTYKLASREFHPEYTVIDLRTVKIGGNNPKVLMAGPCSVETLERTLAIAEDVKASGAKIFRAGAFKLRCSPYSFQGLEEEGLKILSHIRKQTGLKIISEVVSPEHVELMCEHIDILQVGTRNMYNYPLLKKLGKTTKPILLKRGLSATLEEWLHAAEYLMNEGNARVILCERGIRTFSQHTRNTLDLNAVPLLKELTHLPVFVDPSHGIGKRRFVRVMSRAALACGADGLLIEAHTDPDSAYSDSSQTVSTSTLGEIVRDIQILTQLENF